MTIKFSLAEFPWGTSCLLMSMKFHFNCHRVKTGFSIRTIQYFKQRQRETKRKHCRKSKVFYYLSKPFFFAKYEICQWHYFATTTGKRWLFHSFFCSTNYKSHALRKKSVQPLTCCIWLKPREDIYFDFRGGSAAGTNTSECSIESWLSILFKDKDVFFTMDNNC